MGVAGARGSRMAAKPRASLKQMSDEALVERVQSILINAAEGRRSVGDDAQFDKLRRELIRRPLGTPELVSTHPTVDSFSAFIRGLEDRRERVKRVRDQFEPVFRSIEATEDATDSSAWTGTERRATKLKVVRKLLPLARAAIDAMIENLSQPGPNHGPILDEHEEAIGHLRQLHRALGEVLEAAEAGHLDDELGQGLVAEGARYAKRAARALSRDPMPYATSSLLLGILWTCGFPTIGGHLATVALMVQKNLGKGEA
jgi:hypothetical protein